MTFQLDELFDPEKPGEPAMMLRICNKHEFASRDASMPCPDCYFEYVRDFNERPQTS